MKARDVHVAQNKEKFLFIFRTSKTHWKNMKPQIIKITSKRKSIIPDNCHKYRYGEETGSALPCPYTLLCEYIAVRGKYSNIHKQFFVFADKSSVKPAHFRTCLKTLINEAGFQFKEFYTVHRLRSGRCCDLLELEVPIDRIQKKSSMEIKHSF